MDASSDAIAKAEDDAVDAEAKAEDDAVDAEAEAADPAVKSVSTSSGTNIQESEAEAAEREAGIDAQIEYLESLPENMKIPYLMEQLEEFHFPKQCSVRVRKLSEDGMKLFNRFLTVDSVTPVTRMMSDVNYTVKESRIGSELFEKNFEAICQELDRVRGVLENREQWLTMFPDVIELIKMRAQVEDEIIQIDRDIEANTPNKNSLNQVPNLNAEEKLENLIKRRDELFLNAEELREKEFGIQGEMKALDTAVLSSRELSVAFDTDESWMDEAARLSLESLLANVAANKKLDLEDDRNPDDFKEAVSNEMMDRLKEKFREESFTEELATEEDESESKETEENIVEDADINDTTDV